MGLTIILGVFIYLLIVFNYDKPHKTKTNSILKGLSTVFSNLAISVGLSLFITFIITLFALSVASVKEDDFIMVDRQVEELQEFAPNLYVVTGIEHGYRSPDHAKVTVLVNDETRNIHLQDAKIILNSSEHMMETRSYDFANPILRWLFFNPQVKEHDIYTPQSSLGGAFTIR